MVWSNYRMKVKAPCRMDLKMFPFDTQQCTLIFESYSYNMQEVKLTWHDEPVTFMSPVDLPDFSLKSYKTEKVRLQYPNGLWDELQVTFVFSRRYGFYLFQAYFPTLLTVISSWVGFFLDARAVSARITLAVSSLLALTFQFGTVLKHLPRVSYIKCLDVWMICCVSFIFFTLCELVIVCQLAARDQQREMSAKIMHKWLAVVRKRKILAAASARTQPDRQSNPEVIQNGLVPDNGDAKAKSAVSRWKMMLQNKADEQLLTTQGTSMNAKEQSVIFTELNPIIGANGSGRRETETLLNDMRLPSKSLRMNDIRERFQDYRKRWKDFRVTAVMVDRFALFLFPFVFGLFNIVYWSVYFVEL